MFFKAVFDCQFGHFSQLHERKQSLESDCARVRNILEQLSRTQFFTGYEIPALFPLLHSMEEKSGIFKPRKNRVLESCSTYFSLWYG